MEVRDLKRKIYSNYIALSIIMIMYAGLSILLFNLANIPFDSDEAIHALDGLRIASDIYHRDIKSFLEHFYFTGWYPPLLPTYLGFFFIFLKPSYWSARYPILLLAIICIALMYRVSKKLAKNSTAGLITLSLVATSPLVWMHSLLCMEEMLAILGVLLTVLVYIQVDKDKMHPSWVGVCMVATLLARLSVGIYLVGAVALMLILDWFKYGRERAIYIARILAPLTVFCVIWWGHPSKLENLFNYIQASPPAYESFSWRPIVYYWEAIMTVCTVSPLIGSVVLMAIVYAIFYRKDKTCFLPLALLITTWIVLLLKRQLNLRFFISGLFSAFIITGCIMTNLHSHISFSKKHYLKKLYTVFVVTIIVSSALFLFVRISSFPLLMEIAYETDSETVSLFAWVANKVDKETPIFFVNGWDQMSTSGFNFYAGMEAWPHWRSPQAIDVLLVDPDKQPQLVEQFHTALASTPKSYVIHLSNTPVPNAGAWWAYQSALHLCWQGEWQSETSFWIRSWDGSLENEIMRYPFQYMYQSERLALRESYWYPLLVEIRIAECRNYNN